MRLISHDFTISKYSQSTRFTKISKQNANEICSKMNRLADLQSAKYKFMNFSIHNKLIVEKIIFPLYNPIYF